MALKEMAKTWATGGLSFILVIFGVQFINIGMSFPPQPWITGIGAAMILAGGGIFVYVFIYHRYFRFMDYIFLELLVRTGGREKKFIRLAVPVDEIEGVPIKETDLMREGEMGQLARQLDAIGQAYLTQLTNYLTQLGEPKLYWYKIRGLDMLEDVGQEKEMIFGTTVPLLQHDDPVASEIFVMGYPAKVKQIFLEGILLSRAVINRIEVTPTRRILGFLKREEKPYYLIQDEIPVILIDGSCHIAQKRYLGIFNLPVWTSHRRAIEELAEIRDKSVEHYIDTRSEAEKLLLRQNQALRNLVSEGFAEEMIVRGYKVLTEQEEKRERMSRLPIILLIALAAFLLTLTILTHFPIGGV